MHAHTTLPSSPGGPADARHWVRTELAAADPSICAATLDDAELVVSELVTNALRAECSEVDLVVDADERLLRLVVTDDADGVPQLRAAGVRSVSGRGLFIVAALTQDWGVDPIAGGKAVWAELLLDPQDETGSGPHDG